MGCLGLAKLLKRFVKPRFKIGVKLSFMIGVKRGLLSGLF